MNSPQIIIRSQSAEADAFSGLKKSSRAERIADGLYVAPFSLGGRAKGFFRHEMEAIAQARASGACDDEVRVLVAQLTEARQSNQNKAA